MKNIRINYRSENPSIQFFESLKKSFVSKYHSVTFAVYDFSLNKTKFDLIEDTRFKIDMAYEDMPKSSDLILLDSKKNSADICVIINDGTEFVGDLDYIVDQFNDQVGTVYADYYSAGVYVYLKSPPVNNMITPLLFINLQKVNVEDNIIEDVFSSNASIHIPRGYSRVNDE